jgi:hypothetical protein
MILKAVAWLTQCSLQNSYIYFSDHISTLTLKLRVVMLFSFDKQLFMFMQ